MREHLKLDFKLNLERTICFLCVGLISVGQAAVPPIPKGIFSMTPAGNTPFPDQILDDPRIVGVDLGGSWGSDFESSEGVYDWSAVDSEVARAESYGKKILLRINSGGVNVPAWLLANPNVQTFTFIDQNVYHSTYGQELTMPLFWDPIFLEKKLELIAEAGAHFAGHASIQVVACAFANSTTGDWSIPHTSEDIANWRAAGYTTDKMVEAGKIIVDATMAAFPNQNVALSIGIGAGDLDPTPDYLAETVIAYATTTYGRFLTQKNSLSATTIDPVASSALGNWQVVFDQTPNVAAQMLWHVSDDSTYRMNDGIPGTDSTILLQAINVGAHYGTQYQEIYESDLADPDLSSVIDYANAVLTPAPALPVAPDNATATSNSLTQANLTWRDNADNELGYRIESKGGLTDIYELITTLGPNSTSITVTRLVEGTRYYYRVQAVNAGGVSDYSNETSVATVLSVPGNLTAKASSSSQITLTWTDKSSTENGFVIERSPVTNSSYAVVATVGANTTSFTDSGLSESTKYWYRVRAYNSDTSSAYSSERQATTLHDLPAAPSALAITSLLSTKVTLSWTDNSDNESGFNIQRREGASGTFANIKTTAANTTSYTDHDSTLTDGTSYSYRVCSTNSAGDSAYSNIVSGTTTLNAPTALTAQAISSSQISLTWSDKSATETGFSIERSPVTQTNYAVIATVGTNVTSFTDSDLNGATKYWYRVLAYNDDTMSAYSNEKGATTPNSLPAEPSGLLITSLLTDKVILSWTDNSDNESGFKVQRKKGADGTYADIRTTAANVTAYTDKDGDLTDGTFYLYQVCSTNSAGDSLFSNEVGGMTALNKPTAAKATAISSSQIDLAWVDNSSSETGYKIERKKTSGGTYAQIASVEAGVQNYSDTTELEPDTRYYYRVRATNGMIDSDYSNEPFAVTLP